MRSMAPTDWTSQRTYALDMDEPIVMDVELPEELARQIEDNRAHPERRRPRPPR